MKKNIKKCIKRIKKIKNIKSIITIAVLIIIIIAGACMYKASQDTDNNQVETTTEKVAIEGVKATDTISVTYTGSLEDGTIFDASSKHPGEILSFIVGAGRVIPGFENGVLGMKVGESKTIKIDAIDAYGESEELLLTEEDFAAIGQGGLNKEDMVIGINTIGELGEIEILRIEGEDYYAKHPSQLAGKNLIFEVTIDTITPFKIKEIVSVGDNIAVIYTGSLKDGTVFDTNNKEGGRLLEFTAGAGQMIPGFDAGVIGMKLGETKIITIPAAEAYGEEGDHDLAGEDLTFEITVESIK